MNIYAHAAGKTIKSKTNQLNKQTNKKQLYHPQYSSDYVFGGQVLFSAPNIIIPNPKHSIDILQY